jgi:hypothetical protein
MSQLMHDQIVDNEDRGLDDAPLVVFDQTGARRDRDAAHHLGYLVVGEKGVDAAQRALQHWQQHHLVEATTMTLLRRLNLLQADDGSAQALQLVQQRRLDVALLVQANGGVGFVVGQDHSLTSQ